MSSEGLKLIHLSANKVLWRQLKTIDSWLTLSTHRVVREIIKSKKNGL